MNKEPHSMQRISISLPASDYALLMSAYFAEQQKQGKPLSVSEFVRDTLRKTLQTTETE